MKLIHLSDLHIGKRVNEVSMIEDQAYVLTQVIQIIDREKPDAVLIAGDVYDKTVPPAEAVTLFDDFLCRLAQRHVPVLIISGNHDSAERLAFGARLLAASGITISPVYDGTAASVTLRDEYGDSNTYRIGGDEFVAFRYDRDEAAMRSDLKKVRSRIEAAGYHVACGLSVATPDRTFAEVLKAAEKEMYADKKRYYDSIGKDMRG